MNPISEGIKVNMTLDLLAKPFSDKDLADIYYKLSADAEDEALLCETATMDEIETEYNPGVEMLLEAVIVRKFSQTKRRMAALVRALNKNFDEITAQEAIIGKVKRSGLFASITVQIPLSDGQVISIVFHSPDDDNLKIMPDDKIIAFRWLLNKRDITQAVSPEEDREVSLEQISKRITQIAAKNSERFQKRQKEVGKQKAELRTAQADLEITSAARDDLMMEITAQREDSEDMDMTIKNVQAQLSAAIALNADLQKQIDGWKAAEEKAREQEKAREEDAAIAALEREALDLGMTEVNIQAVIEDKGVDGLRRIIQDLQTKRGYDEEAAERLRLANIGREKIPGIRLGNAESAGRVWEYFQNGKMTQEEWDKYVDDMYVRGYANRPEPTPEPGPEVDVKINDMVRYEMPDGKSYKGWIKEITKDDVSGKVQYQIQTNAGQKIAAWAHEGTITKLSEAMTSEELQLQFDKVEQKMEARGYVIDPNAGGSVSGQSIHTAFDLKGENGFESRIQVHLYLTPIDSSFLATVNKESKSFYGEKFHSDIEAAVDAAMDYVDTYKGMGNVKPSLVEKVRAKFENRTTASLKRSLETKKGNIDDESIEFTRRMGEEGKTWKFDGNDKVAISHASEPTPEPEPEPDQEKAPEPTPETEEPEAVKMLNRILNGDLDDDPDAIDRVLDQAADELENAGRMEEFDDLLNEAADHYTVVLEQMKEAA